MAGGKRKRAKSGRDFLSVPATSAPIAERHEFAGGFLGHDPNTFAVSVGERTAFGLDVFHACVDAIAATVAGSDMGQWSGTERVDPPAAIVRTPDPDLNQWEFLYLFAANLAVYQAVYLEEAVMDGAVIAVRCVAIPLVTRIGDDTYINGRKTTNNLRLVRRSLMPTLDLDTASIISLGREEFAATMAASLYTTGFWERGGAPSTLLKTDQVVDDTIAQGIRDAWSEQRASNPGSPAVLGRGVELQTFGANLGTEGAVLATDKLGAKIARRMRVPPSIVNVASETGSLTYTNSADEGIAFVKWCIQAYDDVIGRAMSRYLPGDDFTGDTVVIDSSKFKEAGQLERFNAWESAIRAGWLRRSEVRAREKLPPDDGVDATLELPPADPRLIGVTS